MAENVEEEDGVFWLPSEFLSDDENENDVNKKNDDVSRRMFSYLSSPLGSSETESSDEDDQYLAELTRRVANTSLGLELDLHRNSFVSPKPKGVVVNGSPGSTMCGCCGKISSSSSQGSPNSVCHVTSQRATWDLLREAAGEVERMRVSDEERRRFFINHHHQNARLVVPNRNNYNGIVGFNHNQHSLTHQQLQIAQFEMMRQQQMAKQRYQLQQQQYVPVRLGAQNRGKYGEIGGAAVGGDNGGRNVNGGLCATAWPPLQRNVKQHQHLQKHNGVSGMRAVFPVNPSGKRESTGTGVFLPRRIDAPPETKKKSACSTVLVPARVVQALNLKLEDMVPQNNHNQPHFNVTPSMENVHAGGGASAIQRTRCNYGFPQQRRNNQRPQPQVNREVRLPQDWTY